MIKNRAEHGLILLTLRNALVRIGLDFEPYWIEREGLNRCAEPQIRDDQDRYRIEVLDDEAIRKQYRNLSWNASELEDILKSDHYSYGLYREDQLAAFMITRINQYTFKNRQVLLRTDEAYLENMYTYENFRGKNIAPYLRYQCYKLLAKEGKTTCYSITQCFNTSSLKFKAKLNAQHQELWLHMGLFKKFRWNFRLKQYPLHPEPTKKSV